MVFTEDHKGYEDRIRRAYINDLFVFVTFVAFCRFCLRLLCSVGRRATDPASVRSTSYRRRADEQELIPTDGRSIERPSLSSGARPSS
jgi:hypothetical protein